MDGGGRAARSCVPERASFLKRYAPRREGEREGDRDSATSLEFQPGVFKTIVLTPVVASAVRSPTRSLASQIPPAPPSPRLRPSLPLLSSAASSRFSGAVFCKLASQIFSWGLRQIERRRNGEGEPERYGWMGVEARQISGELLQQTDVHWTATVDETSQNS